MDNILIEDDILTQNNDYIQLDKNITEILDKIECIIGTDRRDLLESLEDSYNRQQAIIIKLMYTKGYSDCQEKVLIS